MKVITLTLISFLLPLFILAQAPSTEQKVSFGFFLGADISYLKTEFSDWDALGIQSQINSIETQQRFGLSLGLSSQIKLSELISVVPQALISFQDSRIIYDLENQASQSQEIKPASIAFPLHLVLTNTASQKVQPSITFGARSILDISEEVEGGVPLNQHDFTLDLGTGLQFKWNKMRVKPELIYAVGLNNLKADNGSLLSNAINEICRDYISFRVSFYSI